MAVSVANGNPIVVSNTTTTNDVVLAATNGVFVKFVKWHVPSTTGHLAALKTSDGRLICKFRCENATESRWAPVWTSFENIYCDDLDSGELHIYIR